MRRPSGLFSGMALLGVLATAAMLAAINGCDDASSHGPPRAEVEPDEATTIGVVLPAGGFAEIEVWDAVARRQEGRTRAVASIYRLEKDDPPAKQADLIRKAREDGCSALVLLALDGDSVAPAVAEVRKAGTPVVLLETPVPPLGQPPIPLVTYEDEAAPAKQLVKAAIEDAREAKFPDDGPALILAEKRTEPHTRARIRLLRETLKAAGVRLLPDVEFDGLISEAKTSLKAAHDITPHVAMVFAMDDLALRGAAEYRNGLDHKERRFVLAGYGVETPLSDLVKHNILAAMVERNITQPMRTAFDTALALARGETVPTDIRTPTPFLRRNGPEIEGFFSPIINNPTARMGGNAAEKSKERENGRP